MLQPNYGCLAALAAEHLKSLPHAVTGQSMEYTESRTVVACGMTILIHARSMLVNGGQGEGTQLELRAAEEIRYDAGAGEIYDFIDRGDH